MVVGRLVVPLAAAEEMVALAGVQQAAVEAEAGVKAAVGTVAVVWEAVSVVAPSARAEGGMVRAARPPHNLET